MRVEMKVGDLVSYVKSYYLLGIIVKIDMGQPHYPDHIDNKTCTCKVWWFNHKHSAPYLAPVCTSELYILKRLNNG